MANRINVILSFDATQFERAIKATEKKLGAFGAKLESIGQSLTTRLTLPLGGLAVAAVSAAADLEGLEKGMIAITGSTEEAGKQITRLRELAKLPGLDFPQAIRGSIALQSVGFNAAAAEASLGAFAKAITLTGGTAEDLDEVVMQITQINSKGKLLAEDLRVIQARAPGLGIALKDAFGTTNIEAIRATGISTQEFTRRLVEAINKSETFSKVQGGLNNTLVNFKSAVTAALAQLGQQIIKTVDLEKVIEKLTNGIQAAVDWFTNLSEGTRKTIIIVAGLAAAIGPVLIAIGAFSKVLSIATTGVAALLSPVGLAITALAGLAALFIYAYNNSEDFRRSIAGIGAVLVEVYNFYSTKFKDVIGSFDALKQGDFSRAGKLIKKALIDDNIFDLAEKIGESFNEGFNEGVKKKPIKLKTVLESAGVLYFGETAAGLGGGTTGNTSKRKRQEINLPALLPRESFDAEAIKLTTDQVSSLQNALASSSALSVVFAQRQQDVAAALQQAGTAADLNTISIQQNAGAWEAQRIALEKAELQQERNAAITDALSKGIAGIGDAAAQAIEGAQRFAVAVKRALAELAGEILRIIILDAFKNAQQSPLAKVLGPLYLPIAGAAAAAAGALAKSVIGRVKLAEGGLAYGPTTAIVGDNRNARVDPEVIAPLSKLKNLLGDVGGGYIAEARISGDDLLLLVQRAEYKNQRIR